MRGDRSRCPTPAGPLIERLPAPALARAVGPRPLRRALGAGILSLLAFLPILLPRAATETDTERQCCAGRAPRPRDIGPIRIVCGDVVAPKMLFAPRPDYPEAARRARIEGVVIVEAVLDAEGFVTAVKLLRGLSPELDEQALSAVRRWRFEPATLDGRRVAAYSNLTVNFQLP